MGIPAAAILGTGANVVGSILGGLGRSSEARRRRRAVGRFDATNQQLTGEQRDRELGESEARQGDVGQLISAFGNTGGAQAAANQTVAAVNDRVASTPGAGAPQANPGAYGQLLQQAFTDARAPAASMNEAFAADQVGAQQQRQMQAAQRGSAAAAGSRAPGFQASSILNQIAQANARLELQRALGDYDSGAATQELIGALLQGAGGLGVEWAGQGGS